MFFGIFCFLSKRRQKVFDIKIFIYYIVSVRRLFVLSVLFRLEGSKMFVSKMPQK